MPRRRGRRFLLEVAFLAGVAAGVTVARFHAPAVVALMAAAWILVALLEWTAWRDVPHYGRGLPPRYYVPQVALPPPRAVEQRPVVYPAAATHVEEATWIAPAAEWGETLVDWPVLGRQTGDETEILEPDELDDVPIEAAEGELPAVVAPSPLDEAEEQTEDDVREALEELEPAVAEVARPDPGPAPAPAAVEYAAVELRMPERIERPALHHVDPLQAQARRRWFRRDVAESAIEIRDGAPLGRVLPAALRAGRGTEEP